MNTMQQFMAKVEHRDDHWMWTGSSAGTKSTRPVLYVGNGKQQYAHRWIYERLVGPIPTGYEVDHTCRVGMCVKPDHLEAVTPEENARRTRLSICKKGIHDLTLPENQFFYRKGRRGCLPCRRQSALEYYNVKGRDRRANRRRN